MQITLLYTYIKLCSISISFLPEIGRIIGRNEAFRYGGQQLVAFPLHESSSLDNLVARSTKIGTGNHLWEGFGTFL